MSRIDVVPAEKGKFKVLINMGMDGAYIRSTVILANMEATRIKKEERPNAVLHLIIIED